MVERLFRLGYLEGKALERFKLLFCCIGPTFPPVVRKAWSFKQ